MSVNGNQEPDTGSSIHSNPSQHHARVAQILDKESSEPARSRWAPKPDQILILETYFDRGMVNPTKDETVGIRTLLEKFGPVGDANVFYWFQNRRSKIRRQRRKDAQNAFQFDPSSHSDNPSNNMIIPTLGVSASSSLCGGVEGFFSEMGFEEKESKAIPASFLCPSDTSHLQYQKPGAGGGFVAVFINGVPTEVPKGPLDMKTMCGQDFLLLHSSGQPVLVNEYGFSAHSLHHGESYFLVAKSI